MAGTRIVEELDHVRFGSQQDILRCFKVRWLILRRRGACYPNPGQYRGWGYQMPTKVNVELIIVWACVGFFTGAGWAVATWLVGRILGLTHL